MMATSEVSQPEERIGSYRVHPIASMFPLLEGDEYEDLKSSIEVYGLQRPIVMRDGLLIDGRNRLRICLEIQLEPRFVEYKGALDVADYISVANLDRRHLTEDKRLAIAAQIYTWKRAQAAAKKQTEQGHHGAEGGRGKKKETLNTKPYEGFPEPEPKTREQNANSTVGQVAAAAKVSHHKAAQAVAVAKAAPGLLGQVATGAMKLKDAYAKVKAAKAAGNPQPRHDSSYLDDKTRLIGKIRAAMEKHPRRCTDLQQAIMKAMSATPDAAVEFHARLQRGLASRRKEVDIRARGKWVPDNVPKVGLLRILDWIDAELTAFRTGQPVNVREGADLALLGREDSVYGEEHQL